MTNSIVQSNFNSIDFAKEFKTDDDGKVFVSRRGLARMCGKQASTITRLLKNIENRSVACTSSESLESLLGQGFEGVASISDLVVPLIIEHYAFSGSIEARKHLRMFSSIGFRVFGQQITGYKPNLKRKLTAEEIIEICCLPVPTTWQRRFPEEKINPNTRTRFSIKDWKRVYDIMRVSDFLNILILYHDKIHRLDWAKVWKIDCDLRGEDARIYKEWLVLSVRVWIVPCQYSILSE